MAAGTDVDRFPRVIVRDGLVAFGVLVWLVGLARLSVPASLRAPGRILLVGFDLLRSAVFPAPTDPAIGPGFLVYCLGLAALAGVATAAVRRRADTGDGGLRVAVAGPFLVVGGLAIVLAAGVGLLRPRVDPGSLIATILAGLGLVTLAGGLLAASR